MNGKVTLPDGREVELVEVEVEMQWDGSGFMSREVAKIVPVTYDKDYKEYDPYLVNLWMEKP